MGVLFLAVLTPVLSAAVHADSLTPTPASTATATAVPSTATSTPTPLPTPIQVVRPRPTATLAVVRREKRHHHAPPRSRPTTVPTRRSPTATSTPQASPTLAAAKAQHKRKHKHHHHRRRRHHHKPRPTPTPTVTATPALDLNTEDTISPVTCNGPARPYAAHPFLLPPYHGWTSIVSYIDHDSPNFYRDGLVTIANGTSAQPDPLHDRTDFPAYWNAGMRQYLYYDGHNGYDFNLSYVPVYAAAAGKVIFARLEYPDAPDHGYGNMIMINHRNGYVTLYGHLSKILAKRNQRVRAGQRIGISGNTGHSSGPHLHFTVFHNCTPTDPYGWTGPGPDPLNTYQGESSIYLWRHPPLVDNPAPNWPGIAQMRGTPTERILLLRLPKDARGSSSFSADLTNEAHRVEATLHVPSADVTFDPLRGALLIDAAISPGRIYAAADVASITSPGTVEGERADVLDALAHAALLGRRAHALPTHSRHWSGYLLRWHGRAVIVGRGDRGVSVDLRLTSGRGGAKERHVTADPRTGAYAVDLGPVSIAEFHRLQRTLSGTTHRVSHRLLSPSPHGVSVRRRSSSSTALWLLPLGAGVVLLIVLAWAVRQRGRLSSPVS